MSKADEGRLATESSRNAREQWLDLILVADWVFDELGAGLQVPVPVRKALYAVVDDGLVGRRG